MESKHELKEIDIKYLTCYYFDDIMRVIDSDFSNILLNEKSYKTYENILICDVSYKTFMGSKPLRIRFDEIDGFINIYDGIRYLVLFRPDLYDAIYNRIRYRFSEKSGITDSINHNFARIRLDSYNSLVLIKLVGNKNENYYHNMFLEKDSYEDKSNTQYFQMNVYIL